MMLVIPSIKTLQNQLEADTMKLDISVTNLNKVREYGLSKMVGGLKNYGNLLKLNLICF